ncbi:MAG: DUF5000 domain-containing lipoprotein [Mangrovibacterium sp.]
MKTNNNKFCKANASFYIKLAGVVWLFALIMISCSEDQNGQPPTDSIPPQPVSNIQVESLPGGAKFTYDLPHETDISYVKGEYLFQGKKKVIRSSVYNNFLIVEGLGSVEPLDITLYVVDHSENVSVPVNESFTPGTPPVESIFSSLQMVADFGGVNLTWENETAIEVGITIFASNANGLLEEGETYYTNLKGGNYSFRGYDAQKRVFAVCVTDKWGNVTDTLRGEFTPFFEKLLDKSRHTRLILPRDDATTYNASWTFSNMFNGVVGNEGFHTANGGTPVMPLYITIDLGVEAKLSRFKMWHRQGSTIFGHQNIKKFEAWGASEYKQGQTVDYWSGPWENDWELLGSYEVIKPSGDGPVTAEDTEAAAAGFEFLVPGNKKSLRYFRIKMISNFSGGNMLHMSEMSFYGNDGSEPVAEP